MSKRSEIASARQSSRKHPEKIASNSTSETQQSTLWQDARQKYDIDIRPLKAFVSEKFPKNWPLREALLAERDVLDAEEFLAKMETWLNLLRMM